VRSRIAALVSLWIFFIAQWLVLSLVLPPHQQLSNPIADWDSATMLLAIILYTVSFALSGSLNEEGQGGQSESGPTN
jgi:hypothetical protein